MLVSVELLTDQRNVDDCPRSMLPGSAVKLLMTGLETVGGGVSVRVGGGGGGGGGTFFLQPDANTNNVSASSTALNREACNL